MNCNTCRYELSQCLDGRLPSGRRSAVLAHAESCASCGEFWTELQAAQRLTLSLRSNGVGDSFREGLWERIRAGEGTPDAVFQEPIATWAKVRYALTGAAAAAAVLLTAIQFGSREAPGGSGNDIEIVTDEVARADVPSGNLQDRVPLPATDASLASPPLVSSVRPLTFDLVAVETARQLEQRYANAAVGMRMMSDPSLNREAGLDKVLENAHEMRSFGEMLIDLCDHKRVFFTDNRVENDLRVAVRLLAQAPSLEERSPMLVERFVAPALSSARLGRVAGAITTTPSVDPGQELEALLRLNTTRPDVFRKLFVVLGELSDIEHERVVPRPGTTFGMADACGTTWVVRRSEVDRHTLLRFEVHSESR